MTSLKEFRNEIILYGVVMAAVAEGISLLVIGPSALFAAGLAAGTAVSILGFIILVKTGETLMEESKKSPILLGYIVRLFLYGAVFFICIKLSLPCGFGCGIGLFDEDFIQDAVDGYVVFFHGFLHNKFGVVGNQSSA